MRIGFRKAAGVLSTTLGLALLGLVPVRGGDEPIKAVENTVRLEIQIAGLGSEGGKILIKPAHPGCKFKPIEGTIRKEDVRGDIFKARPILVPASSTNPDRDCSFEITITEPNREPKVFRRGLRLSAPAADVKAAGPKTLKCFLSTTAVAAKEAGKARR